MRKPDLRSLAYGRGLCGSLSLTTGFLQNTSPLYWPQQAENCEWQASRGPRTPLHLIFRRAIMKPDTGASYLINALTNLAHPKSSKEQTTTPKPSFWYPSLPSTPRKYVHILTKDKNFHLSLLLLALPKKKVKKKREKPYKIAFNNLCENLNSLPTSNWHSREKEQRMTASWPLPGFLND